MRKAQHECRSRPPLRRMVEIHKAIQSGHYPNCAGLALEMEVSHKTAKRDVEFMRDELNMPIEFDPHRKGYFYLRPVDGAAIVPALGGVFAALLVASGAVRGVTEEGPAAGENGMGACCEIEIGLDDWATGVLERLHWPSGGEVRPLRGGSRLTLRVRGLDEAEGLVLSLGVHATVIRPVTLADRIRDVAGVLAARYGGAERGRPDVN